MYNQAKLSRLLKEVDDLKRYAGEVEQKKMALLKDVHTTHFESARNLLHYLAIRSHDLRKLQKSLSDLAISSHSHSESYTLNNLQKISYLLNAIAGKQPTAPKFDELDSERSAKILNDHSAKLFGKVSLRGQSKIMVTLPTEAAENYELVYNMVKAGMHVARINTAHDDEGKWSLMIKQVKKAAKEQQKTVKIYMDLVGPKIRTGAIKPSADGEKVPSVLLYTGTRIKINRRMMEGHGGAQPAVSITLPEVLDHVRPDDRVWFDDGQAGGNIIEKTHRYIVVEITDAPEDGFKLREKKGINFPDASLFLPALTSEDIRNLKFIAAHADMVGFSFVQTEEDIYALQKQLKRLKRENIGIILKIETQLAFKNLPSLLFAVMRSPQCGVMIARGDLAVEIGYSRMAEVQEEILWLAEAAHLPVVWATQVLESQVKKGIASRAEISDVVKAVRAECVMLNKGPHIVDAIKTIKDIDRRMANHEDKKRKVLRSLSVAKLFLMKSVSHGSQNML